MVADKVIVGMLEWVNDTGHDGGLRLKAPLDIGGEGRTGLELRGYTNRYLSPQDGSLLLTYHGTVIERMSLFPPKSHANALHKTIPKNLRGITLRARQHRYYAWKNNRRVPRGPDSNLRIAEEIFEKLDSFEAGIKYFCNRAQLTGVVPAPPFEPRLPL